MAAKKKAKAPEAASAEPAAQGSRDLVFLLGADDLKTQEQRDEFVDGLADAMVDAVQEWRKSEGLPPLEE